MSLATHVRTLGRGPGRSRSLTQDEAQDAMAMMLAGAEPEAVGALLMLLRMKGETPEEIAGFAAAAQATLPARAAPDLDWPSYASGRTRGLPWFLLSARLVAQAGYSVLLHGYNGPDPSVRQGIDELSIPTAPLDGTGPAPALAYLPLEQISEPLFGLLSLRPKLGLRSCVNTVCRMLNPGRATASVAGVFHPSYRQLQTDAAQLLGWRGLSVIKGGGGEFERMPTKDITVQGLRRGAPWIGPAPALMDGARRLGDGGTDMTLLSRLWTGDHSDPFAEAIVIGTAALALETLGVADADTAACTLWTNRLQAKAA